MQTSVDNAGAAAGGAGSEIVALHKEHGLAGAGALGGERNPIDAAAEDDDVNPLR
jgi:hypothetical protein